MDEEKYFKKLSLEQKVNELKKAGDYIGSRQYGAYNVHLYVWKTYFVEVYIKIGLNWVQIIEIQKNEYIIKKYADQVDILNELRPYLSM